MNTYTTKLDMQNGTITICSGDIRYPIMIDEWPDLMEKGWRDYQKAKFFISSPLINTDLIDTFMETYHQLHGPAPEFRAMVEFYQNVLAFLKEHGAELADCWHQEDTEGLRSSMDRIEWILEAHKHHMQAIDESR